MPQLLLWMAPVFSSLNCCRSSRRIFTAWYWGTVASGCFARLKNPSYKETKPNHEKPTGMRLPEAPHHLWARKNQLKQKRGRLISFQHSGQPPARCHQYQSSRFSFTARGRLEGHSRCKTKGISLKERLEAEHQELPRSPLPPKLLKTSVVPLRPPSHLE